MVQGFRICLPTQEMPVQSLVRRTRIQHALRQLSLAIISEPTCSRARAPQQEKPQLERTEHHKEDLSCPSEDPAQPETEQSPRSTFSHLSHKKGTQYTLPRLKANRKLFILSTIKKI